MLSAYQRLFVKLRAKKNYGMDCSLQLRRHDSVADSRYFHTVHIKNAGKKCGYCLPDLNCHLSAGCKDITRRVRQQYGTFFCDLDPHPIPESELEGMSAIPSPMMLMHSVHKPLGAGTEPEAPEEPKEPAACAPKKAAKQAAAQTASAPKKAAKQSAAASHPSQQDFQSGLLEKVGAMADQCSQLGGACKQADTKLADLEARLPGMLQQVPTPVAKL